MLMVTSGYKKFGVGLDDEQKREAIVVAARRVLARVGYHQATVQQFLEEAGISRRTFYAYFKSKEDLVSGLIIKFIERALMLRQLEDPSAVNSIAELREQIDRMATGLIGLVQENRDLLRVFFEALALSDDALSPSAQGLVSAITSTIESYVVQAAEKGFVVDVDPKLTSMTLMGIYLEIARRIATGTAPEPIEPWITEILGFITRGLIRPTH